MKPKACLQIQMPRTVRQLWPSRGRVSPAQPPLSGQPNVGRHTHFLLGLHPHKVYLYFPSRTTLQAVFQNHGPLCSLSCVPLPEQGLPNPLIFIMSGCFCSAPLLPPVKNNNLSKVYLNTACGLLNPFFFEVYRSLCKRSSFNATGRCCLLPRVVGTVAFNCWARPCKCPSGECICPKEAATFYLELQLVIRRAVGGLSPANKQCIMLPGLLRSI